MQHGVFTFIHPQTVKQMGSNRSSVQGSGPARDMVGKLSRLFRVHTGKAAPREYLKNLLDISNFFLNYIFSSVRLRHPALHCYRLQTRLFVPTCRYDLIKERPYPFSSFVQHPGKEHLCELFSSLHHFIALQLCRFFASSDFEVFR